MSIPCRAAVDCCVTTCKKLFIILLLIIFAWAAGKFLLCTDIINMLAEMQLWSAEC